MALYKSADPKRQRRFRRWTRAIGVTVCSLVILFFAAYAILAWYVSSHKKELLARITREVSKSMGGTLSIEDMTPSLWGDFPHASIALRNVSLRDSMWSRHHRDLIKAEQIFVRVNPLRLLSNQIDVRKLTVRKGSMFIFTDADGYSNTYLLEGKDSTEKDAEHTRVDFRKFALHDVEITVENVPKLKSFNFLFHRLNGESERNGGDWNTEADADILVRRMFFNKTRGSFLANTSLKGHVTLSYDAKTKDLGIRAPTLLIAGHPVLFQARFAFAPRPPAFNIHLETKNVPYKKAISWVSANISAKLSPFDFEKPVSLSADLSGRMKYRDTPLVYVRWDVRNNTLKTPLANFKNISFGGHYVNEVVTDAGHADPNSRITFENVKGEFEGIPFSADTISATNLLYPLVYFHLRSDFPLKKINDIGELPLDFKAGNASVDVQYKGGIRSDDTLYPWVNGTVRLKDVDVTYVPRGLTVTNMQTVLRLTDDNLYMNELSGTTPGGPLFMEGAALHFFRFYFADPGKVNIYWKATSPGLNLNAFTSLIGRRQTRRVASSAGGVSPSVRRIFTGLDNLLNQCTATLDIDFARLQYQNFVATNLKANAVFSQVDVQFPNVSLNSAGGSMVVSGRVAQGGDINPFALKANFNNVAVNEVFRSFDNFGQDALMAPNLNGRLTASIDASGKMSGDGKVIKRSISGKADFSLQGGALRNFEPFKKISRFAKKRNLDDVRFEKIEDNIEFNGGSYIIHPLVIRSTAFNMKVQGTYAPPTGTDLAITLPLGNPDDESADQRKTKKIARGLTLFLRARDGKDGKVDIDWDPLQKGQKKTNAIFGDETNGKIK